MELQRNGPAGEYGGLAGGEGGARGQPALPLWLPKEPETRPLTGCPAGVVLAALRKHAPAVVGVPSNVQ